MPQRTNAFQQVVRLLHQHLADKATVTESKFLVNRRTGRDVEVDVVIEVTDGPYSLVIGVESTQRTRPASIEWIHQMTGKHEDLPTDRLILVSSSGFTSDAELLAEALGFVALSLEEAESADWTLIVGKLATVHLELVQSQWRASIVTAGDDGGQQIVPATPDLQLTNAVTGATVSMGAVVEAMVRAPEVMQVLMDHMHQNGLSERSFTAMYTPPVPVTAVDASGTPRPVLGLQIMLESKREQTPINLQHGRLHGVEVAFGEARGAGGSLQIAVVEREGFTPVIEVMQRRNSVWERVVAIDAPEPAPAGG